VRPLYDNGASEAKAATRDYVLALDASEGAPLLSIYGGKITTYRRLAEEALEHLVPYPPGSKAREGWTASAPLPGGDLDVAAFRRSPGNWCATIHSSPRRTPTGWRTPTARAR
jgi:glycerol-3-phosphate dehydrogenase